MNGENTAMIGGQTETQTGLSDDERYLHLMLKALSVCVDYVPKFGRGKTGMALKDFESLYQADPFYHWVGLDIPAIYTAHRVAGGLTSLYRQIGLGCQWVFTQILQDHLGLSAEEAGWKYAVPSNHGKTRYLSLDARIELELVRGRSREAGLRSWVNIAAEHLLLPSEVAQRIRGIVFEVRQGYKSKDAKRQNADIANAANAYANLYIPVLALFSLQIDEDIAQRYTQAQWLILRGTTSGKELDSLYTFCKNVIGYDLAGFFQKHSDYLRGEIETIMTRLLQS